jgi:hypothetical protein
MRQPVDLLGIEKGLACHKGNFLVSSRLPGCSVQVMCVRGRPANLFSLQFTNDAMRRMRFKAILSF